MLTKAIILKKENTNEYDQWVTCYTEDFGKLKTVAKSILKPSSVQSLHLDTFNLVEFDPVVGRGMPIITGAQAVSAFRGIKNSVAKTAVAYFITEAIDKMVFENDKDEELWSFLISFLNELDRDESSPVKLLRQGQAKLLDVLGYWPEIGTCRTCDGRIDANSSGAFNYVLGGVICKRCFLSGHGGILMTNDDALMFNKSGSFKSDSYRKSVLDGMFEYISGTKFYSLDFLNVVK